MPKVIDDIDDFDMNDDDVEIVNPKKEEENKDEDDYLSDIIKDKPSYSREPDIIDSIGDKIEDWVKGKELVPEKDTQEFLSTVGDKAKLVNSLVILNGMKRVKRLNEFINSMEEDLFDMGNIQYMSPKQKIAVYRTAVNRVNEIVDNNNKYIGSTDTGMDEETQRIITLAKSVTPETREKLVNMLKGIKDEGSDV